VNAAQQTTPRPLQGVRVLDLTRLMPGNYCTFLLASLGADVLKVEDPGAGDYMRSFGAQVEGQSAIHHTVNRAKRSAVIDLKQEDGRQLLLRLARDTDVLVESFRPGVLAKLGLGLDELRAVNPALVVVSLSGYGATGELAHVAGHDINYMAVSGLLERTGHRDAPPTIAPMHFADLVGGSLLPAVGALAMLYRARTTNVGGHLDASMAESIALLPSIFIADMLAGRPIPGRGETDWGGGLACWRIYALSDGHVAVGAVESQFWQALCTRLGVPELVPIQYASDAQEHIAAVLTERFQQHDRASLIALLEGVDTCASVVNSYEELFASDFAHQRDLVHRHPTIPVPVQAAPFVIDGLRPDETLRAPFQGEQTITALEEWGVPTDELARLAANGVIRQHDPQEDAASRQNFGTT